MTETLQQARWYCIQCDLADDSADRMTMHSANTDHQLFYGTEADRDHHRGVLAKGTTVPATFDAKDALRGFIENVQQIRGELWDAISYVPVDSEAADIFARAARRAMDRLDQLDGLMLDAIDKGTEPTLRAPEVTDTEMKCPATSVRMLTRSLLPSGRVHFEREDGSSGRAPFPSCLVIYWRAA